VQSYRVSLKDVAKALTKILGGNYFSGEKRGTGGLSTDTKGRRRDKKPNPEEEEKIISRGPDGKRSKRERRGSPRTDDRVWGTTSRGRILAKNRAKGTATKRKNN